MSANIVYSDIPLGLSQNFYLHFLLYLQVQHQEK